MFRYRLHSPDGDDLGEATYAQMIKPGEEIIAGKNEHFRVVDAVPFEEEDESPFVEMLGSKPHRTQNDRLQLLVAAFALQSDAVAPAALKATLYLGFHRLVAPNKHVEQIDR